MDLCNTYIAVFNDLRTVIRVDENKYDNSHVNDIVKVYKTIKTNFSLVMDLFKINMPSDELYNTRLKINDL